MKDKILKIFREAEEVKDDEEKFDECMRRLSEMKIKSKEDGTFEEFRNILINDEEVIVFMDSLGEKMFKSFDKRELKLKKKLLKGGKNKRC